MKEQQKRKINQQLNTININLLLKMELQNYNDFERLFNNYTDQMENPKTQDQKSDSDQQQHQQQPHQQQIEVNFFSTVLPLGTYEFEELIKFISHPANYLSCDFLFVLGSTTYVSLNNDKTFGQVMLEENRLDSLTVKQIMDKHFTFEIFDNHNIKAQPEKFKCYKEVQKAKEISDNSAKFNQIKTTYVIPKVLVQHTLSLYAKKILRFREQNLKKSGRKPIPWVNKYNHLITEDSDYVSAEGKFQLKRQIKRVCKDAQNVIIFQMQLLDHQRVLMWKIMEDLYKFNYSGDKSLDPKVEDFSNNNDNNTSGTKLIQSDRFIIEMKTGTGKTITTLKLISLLRMKTLIIVNKNDLKAQWHKEIQDKLGIANIELKDKQIFDDKGNITQVSNDIYVGVINSVQERSDKLKYFDLIVIDEVHRVAAKSFLNVLRETDCTRFVIGLSATPERNDRRETIYYNFFNRKYVCNLLLVSEIRFSFFGFADFVNNESHFLQEKKNNNSSLIVKNKITSNQINVNTRTKFLLRILRRIMMKGQQKEQDQCYFQANKLQANQLQVNQLQATNDVELDDVELDDVELVNTELVNAKSTDIESLVLNPFVLDPFVNLIDSVDTTSNCQPNKETKHEIETKSNNTQKTHQSKDQDQTIALYSDNKKKNKDRKKNNETEKQVNDNDIVNKELKILIAFKNVDYANNFHTKLIELYGVTNIAKIVGSTNTYKDQRIIVGTYRKCSEGLDIKGLNTIIMAQQPDVGLFSLTQLCGRIGRIDPNNKTVPHVIELVDSNFACEVEDRIKKYNKIYSRSKRTCCFGLTIFAKKNELQDQVKFMTKMQYKLKNYGNEVNDNYAKLQINDCVESVFKQLMNFRPQRNVIKKMKKEEEERR